MDMERCEVKENCLNNVNDRGQCWYCEDYSYYVAIDKRIKSKRQLDRIAKVRELKKEKKNSVASMRGKRAKRKGYDGENEVVKLLEKYKIEAKRMPLSGALKGDLGGDVVLKINGIEKKIEVKRRKDGFKDLYKYLEQDNCDYVFMRADRRDWIVVQKFSNWITSENN